MKEIGSHNSWSFVKPVKWYMRPFNCFAKCQAISIKRQYKLGVRYFDIRLREYKDKWYLAHGLMLYCKYEDIKSDLLWLDQQQDCCVRFILEYNKKPKNETKLIETFDNIIDNFLDEFGTIGLFDIRTKWDWKQRFLHKYVLTETELEDRYSSVDNSVSWWEKLLPYRYAKKYNYSNWKYYRGHAIPFVDFVELYPTE